MCPKNMMAIDNRIRSPPVDAILLYFLRHQD